MKTPVTSTLREQPQSRYRLRLAPSLTPAMALLLLAAAPRVLTTAQAQILPPPAVASPSSYANVGGLPTEQYIVYLPGGDPILLNQVRLLEPGAFVTTHQGQPVIQVGRYSYVQNAQQQVNTLSSQGLSAAIAPVAPAAAIAPIYGQVPAPPTTYISSSELPPLPVVAVPQSTGVPPQPAAPAQNVPFGQALTAAPATADMPPPPATPPTTVAAAPATAGAPFYVVIPAPAQDLPTLTGQLVQLGTPADRVQPSQGGLGPHVAVGPFRDRGLAEQWSGYFRDAGFRASRVVYRP
jgi:hypothetical protein